MKATQLTRSAVVAGLALVVAVVSVACQAPLDQKRGALGEFCHGGDNECREGLVCEEGVCQTLNNSLSVCEQVCNRFEECDTRVDNCERSCRPTLQDPPTWSQESAEQYASCYEETDCETLQEAESPPNVCYAELEVAEQRLTRCDTLRSTARNCLQSASGDFENRIDNFFSMCRRKARVVSDQNWSATDSCEEQATSEPVRCDRMFECINDEFPLGEGNSFPTTEPDSNSDSDSESDSDPDSEDESDSVSESGTE